MTGRLVGIVIMSLVMASTTSADPPPVQLVIDTEQVVRELHGPWLGLNVNYLLDHDARRPAEARPLVEALRELGPGYLRYPGGEKSDVTWFAPPPFDRQITEAQPTLNRVGPDAWPSSDRRLVAEDGVTFLQPVLSYDDFIELCRAVEAEPVVVVPLDGAFVAGGPSRQQIIDHAAAWVRYANVTNDHGVTRWELGNESYYDSYGGTATAEQYASLLTDMAAAMRAVDPDVQIGANGPNRWGDRSRVEAEAGPAWWPSVMDQAGEAVDWIALHEYPFWQARSYEHQVQRLANEEALGGGLVRVAQQADRPMLITEAGPIDFAVGREGEDQATVWANTNDMGHAIMQARMLQQWLHRPEIGGVMIWNTRWFPDDAGNVRAYDLLDERNELTATGWAFRAFARHLRDADVVVACDAGRDVWATATVDRRQPGRVRVLLINPTGAMIDVRWPAGLVTASDMPVQGDGAEDHEPWNPRTYDPGMLVARNVGPRNQIWLHPTGREGDRWSRITSHSWNAVRLWPATGDEAAAAGE